MKASSIASLDGKVEANAFEGGVEFLRIGAHDFEIFQLAMRGSILGRMDRVSAPFDEEGEETVAIVGEIDGFPGEDAAVRALSGAVVGAGEGDLIFAELLGNCDYVGRMDGPANEPRISHLADLREVDDFMLRRVRRDDFQVAALSE